MAIVPQPHRPVDLIMQGASTIGQGVGAYMQDKELDKQIHPKLAAYIDRLLAGADPDQLKIEASADPGLAGIFGSIQRGAPVSPQGMVPDLHPQGGLQAPGAVNPAGGPGPYQPVQPPQSVPQANQQQHSLAQAAVGGPGQINTQSLGAMDVPPQQAGGRPNAGLGGMDALAMMAQPMQGAPQVQADTRPSVSSFMPKPQAQAPAQPQQSGYTRRDLQSIAPLIPTIEAGRSREMVAKMGADTKLKTEQSKNLRLALAAKAKEEGLDARMIQSALLATEGMDDKMQIAYFKAMIDLQRAQIGAEATKSAAGIRAAAPKSGPNPTLESLKAKESQIKTWTAVTDWEKQPELRGQVQAAQQEVWLLQDALGIPRSGGPTQRAAPLRSPPPQQPPPPTNTGGGTTPNSGNPPVGLRVVTQTSKKTGATRRALVDAAGNTVQVLP